MIYYILLFVFGFISSYFFSFRAKNYEEAKKYFKYIYYKAIFSFLFSIILAILWFYLNPNFIYSIISFSLGYIAEKIFYRIKNYLAKNSL